MLRGRLVDWLVARLDGRVSMTLSTTLGPLLRVCLVRRHVQRVYA
jgi:hypothetical protein